MSLFYFHDTRIITDWMPCYYWECTVTWGNWFAIVRLPNASVGGIAWLFPHSRSMVALAIHRELFGDTFGIREWLLVVCLNQNLSFTHFTHTSRYEDSTFWLPVDCPEQGMLRLAIAMTRHTAPIIISFSLSLRYLECTGWCPLNTFMLTPPILALVCWFHQFGKKQEQDNQYKQPNTSTGLGTMQDSASPW